MEDRLEAILSNINNWLRFAEEKNAALIALNGGILFAIISLVSDGNKIISYFTTDTIYYKVAVFYFWNFVLFSVSGLLIALFSFLPQTKILSYQENEKRSDQDNLLFYSHIKKYDAETYLSKLHQSYGIDGKYSKCELDYANQIVMNSKIAYCKYFHFRIALWSTIAAILTPIVGYCFYCLLDSDSKRNKFLLLFTYSLLATLFYVVVLWNQTK